MRQTFGDKQRDAQRRKKEEEEWRKAHPEPPPADTSPRKDAENKKPTPEKGKKRKISPTAAK
jgi:hypothetical protein